MRVIFTPTSNLRRMGTRGLSGPHPLLTNGVLLLAGLTGVTIAVTRGQCAPVAVAASLLIAVAVTSPSPAFAFVLGTLVFAVTVDLGRAIPVSPTLTLSGFITIALTVLGAATLPTVRVPRAGWRLTTPLILLVLVGVTWQVRGVTPEGMQAIVALALFVEMILVTSALAAHGPLRSVRLVGLALTAGGLAGALSYLGLTVVGPAQVLGPRAIAAYLSMALAWTAARWSCGEWRYGCLSLLIASVIGITLSRTALAAALVMLGAAALVRGPARQRLLSRRFAGLLLAGALAVVALLTLVRFATPIRERFMTGDVILVGGVPLNLMGRGHVWGATWRSAMTSPLVGQGPGSARSFLASLMLGLDHPHNDYLRLFHDFGLVGWLLWLLFLRSSCRLVLGSPGRLGVPRFGEDVQRAGLLGVLAFSLLMATDNVLVYAFVLGPFGALLGLAAGVAGQAGRGKGGIADHFLPRMDRL